MERYKDFPMDYADATLVSLAEDFSITHVVTFDRKDFGIYRLPSKQPFLVLP
jgi:predicted nucleic acid-binding protein